MYKRFILYLLVCLWVSGLQAQEKTILIDMSEEYQTIDNFGASDCWSMQKIGGWYIAQKERVADLLFSRDKGIGLSAWRFNIGAGINRATIQHDWRTVETFEVAQDEYDWTKQEEERWFLQAAKERGVDQFIAFVNSPPARMNRNGYTNCTDGLGSSNLMVGYENQFAAYLVDILKQFRDEWDTSFDFISPVNEPQWEWNNGSNQEGNRASNDDIKVMVEALYSELQNQDVATKISLLESGDLRSWYQTTQGISSEYGKIYGNYLADLVANQDISNKIGSHISGHSYWSDRVSGQLVEDREALYLKILPFLNNGWKYWMTEYCILDGPEGNGGRGRDLTMKTALDVARVIHYDLTILQASAWQWWTAVSPEDYKDGLIYTDYKDNPSTQNIIESKLLWSFGNFSRYIRPGSKRIKLTGAENKFGLLGSAYLDSDNDSLIVVLINMGYSGESVAVNISSLDSNEKVLALTPNVTSDKAGDDLKEYPSFSTNENYLVPARSVVTLVGEISDTTDAKHTYKDFKLFQNYPNPFNKGTKFYYYVPQPVNVQISIYSLSGEKIKTVINGDQPDGMQSAIWDGTDYKNRAVSSGIYFYSMQVGGQRDVKKMVFTQ